MRILLNFIIPGSFLIMGALFFLNSPYLQQVTRFQIDFGAIIIAILCALLAWRFDRSRIIYVLQVLLYANIGIRYLNGTGLHLIITALLLINLTLVAILKERGIHSFRGFFLLCLPAFQAVGLHFWQKSLQQSVTPLFEVSYLNLPAPLATVPELILLIFIISLLIQSIRFLRYPNPLEGALSWVIIGVAASLFFSTVGSMTILHTVSILALLISFIEIAYSFAYRDELTGVPGRRALMETFSKLSGRYAIAMVDIDFFKKFNDKYGHDIGDQVLKMVAARLAKCSGGGKAFRYGGEEFCVVFSGKGAEECLDHLETLRSSIGDEPFTFRKLNRPIKKPKKPTKNKSKLNAVKVTVSIGIAEKTSLYNQPEVVMKRADQALYRAKDAGRNQVCS